MDRVSTTAHLAMAGGVPLMLLSPAPAALTWLETTVYAAATVWFLGRAGRGRLPNVHHAAMAAVMTWMAGAAALGSPTVGRVLGAYFLCAVPCWAVAAIRQRRPGPLGHAALSVGMAGFLLAAPLACGLST